MARINKTQYAVLGCLSIRAMSAYDIKQFMAKTTAYFWTEREGQLYPTLTELQDKNLVTCREEEAAKVGLKKIYQITSHGHAHLEAWLAQTVEQQVYRNELLLKLFFGNNQNKKNNLHLLQDHLIELQKSLSILQVIKTQHVNNERKIYVDITLDYGLTLISAEIDWCKKSIILLEK